MGIELFGHIWSTEARDTLASVLFLSRVVKGAKKTVDSSYIFVICSKMFFLYLFKDFNLLK
ncbi:hypothetical protein bcgnr5380_15840 [Bacillus cereus]